MEQLKRQIDKDGIAEEGYNYYSKFNSLFGKMKELLADDRLLEKALAWMFLLCLFFHSSLCDISSRA